VLAFSELRSGESTSSRQTSIHAFLLAAIDAHRHRRGALGCRYLLYKDVNRHAKLSRQFL
jgi:hypothetical protein